MKPLLRAGIIVTAASVTVSFLTVCVPAAAAAQPGAPAVVAPGVASASWAYGALGTQSWTGSGGTFAYDASLTVGFAVILHETPWAENSSLAWVNRTMGVMLSVEYCLPSCAHAVETATIHYHVWESVHSVLNFTNNGSVEVGASSVPALALTSEQIALRAGLHESVKVVDDGVVLRARNISVGLLANSSVVFSPTLGLIPLTLPAGTSESWTASSAYVAVDSGQYSLVASLAGGAILINETNIPLEFTSAGSVAVAGSYAARTIHLAGANYDVVTLALTGLFALREGFLLIPTGADLFGASAPSWLTPAGPSSNASVTEESVDVTSAPAQGSHLGFEGSDLGLRSGTSNPAAAAPTYGLEPALAAMPSVASGNATSVQGGPESVAQATTDQNCLATGVGCPTSTPSRGLFGELVGLVAGIAVIAVAIVLVAERRRLPPSPYPNAVLYPPGGTGSAGAGGTRRPGTPTPPPAEDPLGHLW